MIGTGLVLLTLSLVASGIHALGRRKRIDTFMLTLGIIFLTGMISAALAVGFAADAPIASGRARYTFQNPPPGGFGPGMVLGPQILRAADADNDGRVSPKEAAEAAEKFVREADSQKRGSVDLGTLSGAINRGPFSPPNLRLGTIPTRFLAAQFVELVDVDKDGHITPEEAVRFIREADSGGRGYVDTGDVDAALAHRIGSSSRAVPTQP